jgi:hypothetical protein
MIRSRSSWLVGALACGALIAGCGGSSSTTSTPGSTAASTGTTPTNTSATTTPGKSTPSGLSGAALAQAVTICKNQIKAQTTLPAGAKTKLEGVCEDAAKGNRSAVKKAAREVCEEVVNGAKVPPGAAKEQALAACKSK